MNKKLLVALTLITGQAIAMEPMEMTIDNEKATTTDTTEKKVVIQIQDQEREIPARFIPLIGTLATFYEEGTPLKMSPMTLVSLDTWQLIEDQLERVYAITQGNQPVRNEIINEIIAVYRQLDTTMFIELIRAVDFLDIPLLKKLTQQIAQNKLTNKLTFDEILLLPEFARNELIKCKVRSLPGPVVLKEIAVCRGHWDIISDVCVTLDGKIVSGSYDGTMCIWNMNGQLLASCRGHESRIYSSCVTPHGKIVSGSRDKTVRIWNMNGQELAIYRGHEDEVNVVRVTPDGKIVSGSDDRTVRILDRNGQELAICRGHQKKVLSVGVTPDGKIISGDYDGAMGIWNIDGQLLATSSGHKLGIMAICVTPDGKIVSGAGDRTVRIWDMNGQELAICTGHKDWIMAICATPEGKIVSGSIDRTVRIWNMNGKELAVCTGHEGPVSSVCATPDGKIVSGSYDRTVRVWNMNGQELVVCRGHQDGILSVRITPDGKIVSGAGDRTVRIWDINLLLNRLSCMNAMQAQAICKILQSSTYSSREEQEQCWKAIWNVFFEEEEELPVKPTSWCTLL